MKRGGPIRRRKPLLSGSSLSRKSRVAARAPMRAVRHRLSPAEQEARALVKARSGGICEGCGLAPATDWAHRKARSQGGPWDAANGLHLCGVTCHRWAHANPDTARVYGWSVRRGHDYLTTPVWTARHGWVLLASDGTFTTTEKRAA